MGLILIISAIPNQSLPKFGVENIDKLFHFVEYCILGWLGIKSCSTIKKSTLFLVIFGGIIFGGMDELWQGFISNRNTSLLDFCADSFGILIGSYFGFHGSRSS
jgi:VanZ family protein